MRSKVGAAHFEMIISFTFFVGFVFFLFLTLDTPSNTSLFDSVVVSIQDDFEDAVGVNFASVFLMVNYSGSKSCVKIDFSDVFVLDFSDADSLARALDGSVIGSSFNGNQLRVDSSEEFSRVYFSEEFNGSALGGCGNVDSYRLGNVVEKNVVSYSKLVDMRDKYFSDYDGLKSDLRVPAVFDFAIVPYDLSEAEMFPVGGISNGVDVLAKDKVFEVLRSDGVLSNERIGFRVW